ncbi:GH116 family glycosyl hydrolase [Flagellimonas onchidii]|uniref:GH116 family glycosyl hydrolase n=1 Tax=Flagellimonas onchidii TaxID=2562684 RepID=UPI0010A5D655|nr:GH116 family glycosyl hydrolase [Allomuricauda onchidii]
MKNNNKHSRRKFLQSTILTGSALAAAPVMLNSCSGDSNCCNGTEESSRTNTKGSYNTPYTDAYIDKIAFPIGGLGAGMFCIEGTGAISHMSVRNKPDIFHEPCTFAAIKVKGLENGVKVLEGPVPERKIFGQRGTGRGAAGTSLGLPRFSKCKFDWQFPFAKIDLEDGDIPMKVKITAWSPFIPGDEDNSGMPVGAFEYTFENTSGKEQEAVFSWNAKNFMSQGNGNYIGKHPNGFVLGQKEEKDNPWKQGQFAAFVPDDSSTTDHAWFRGGWWDPLSMAWNKIEKGDTATQEPVEGAAPGASVFVPFTLAAGESKTIKLLFAWYVPESDIRLGATVSNDCQPGNSCAESNTYKPWYSSRFASLTEVSQFWQKNYTNLQEKTQAFTDTFYASTLPDEVMEAVAANLTILKSPTILRQTDGNLWGWEGCNDQGGCCHGSCTHVWNYAQAIPHLFPAMERTLRQTEFTISQDNEGHQTFRSSLPIRKVDHNFYSAADGQLGGIMKVYRDWRIYGDNNWMEKLYPNVKESMDYCIRTWDPKRKGILEEPHHNTYDVEFWGPNGMCTSFYLGALAAFVEISKALNQSFDTYAQLLEKGKKFMEEELFDGEYFIHKIQWTGLEAKDPIELSKHSWTSDYSKEAKALLEKEGPKYQYGKGCLSDGILGMWIASCAGLEEPVDNAKVTSHLKSIHKYNLIEDLRDYPNPQRPAYAAGAEGGLLLCSWPKGGKLSLPFVYSNEVWTGIEYQVASHLMMKGQVEEGLEIVRTCRARYDGNVRNPFNEYECGHWYARAMASYGLLQGLTGVRYDAVEKALYIDSRIGDEFTTFLSTETGFGNVGLKNGKPFVNIKEGTIAINTVWVSGEKKSLSNV